MPHGEHHIHRRKRIHKMHQEYPHPDAKVKFLDNLCMVVAVLMPLSAMPQIYKIWRHQIVDGISIWMWIFYSILIVPMLIYGIVHEVKQLVVLNIMWLLMNSLIIIGVIVYS
jgi:uncharacterized protein with PQ loop repeat